MALTSSITLSVASKLTNPGDLGVIPKAELPPYAKFVELASGTGAVAGVADKLFYDQRQIAAGGSETLDLYGGLTDAFGAVINFARIKAICFSAIAGNTNNVVIGAAAANQWITLLNSTGTITLRPGDTVAAFSGAANATGWPVTDATGDQLKVANSAGGTTVDYEIVIIGSGT